MNSLTECQFMSARGSPSARRSPPTLAYVTNWNTRMGWREVTAHPDFFDGAAARAKELGYNLEHFWMREPALTHGRLSRILHTRGINGVIIAFGSGQVFGYLAECDHTIAETTPASYQLIFKIRLQRIPDRFLFEVFPVDAMLLWPTG